MLQYSLDQRKEGSLYGELVRLMRADISSGRIAPDEHLPSKRDFARSLGVSVITVEHAYQQLVAEGYVRSVERKGYFANDIGTFSIPVSRRPASLSPTAPKKRALPADVRFDLTGGVAPGSFPRKEWSRLLREVVEDAPDELLLKPAPATGVQELKVEVARHVERFRGMSIEPDQVVIGAGSQVFYTLIAQLLGSLGPIAVEDPGYPTLTRAYRSLGLDVRPVPIDENGIDVARIRKTRASVAHVMPSHHFPTGSVMSISRRYELLGWASESEERYIIEDDYDCEFRHSGHPIPALQGIDAGEKVIYLNTFARSLAPSLRLGYMVLPPHLMERLSETLGFYASSVSTVEQLVLARFMSRGLFDKHVNRMRRRYRESRDAALGVVEQFGLSVSGKDAGLHFVLDCASPLDELALKKTLESKGVRVRSVGEYRCLSSDDCELSTSLVICYAGLSPEDAAEAMRIVCNEIAKARRAKRPSVAKRGEG